MTAPKTSRLTLRGARRQGTPLCSVGRVSGTSIFVTVYTRDPPARLNKWQATSPKLCGWVKEHIEETFDLMPLAALRSPTRYLPAEGDPLGGGMSPPQPQLDPTMEAGISINSAGRSKLCRSCSGSLNKKTRSPISTIQALTEIHSISWFPSITG
jgi:hypothetical protein